MAQKRTRRHKRRVKVPIIVGDGAETILARGIKADKAKVLRSLSGYAAPNFWGPDVTVASHIGSVTFTISYEAVSEATTVFGRVTYWKGSDGGSKVSEEFLDETTITTSNSVATVVCDFKGVPFGSAVDIKCDP